MFKIKNTIKFTGAALLLATSFLSQATVVEVQTSLGNIQINLFDETTPKTVENFLSYVNSGQYANSVVHRSIPEFITQSGGYTYTGPLNDNNGLELIDTSGGPVVNEPELSNLRGTIAMAKLGGDPNSATSGWFFNLVDNSANLDVQNGGFTVFGQVIGDGMDVVDAIAALPREGEYPIIKAIEDGVDITDENLVVITDIVVTDATVVTNPDLNPAPNTLINASPGGNTGDDSSSGGGSFVWLSLFAALGLSRYFRRKK
ncbi:peptidylprolyl isomerase [Paraglaciecola aquimarina]|uniref:Peptidyl-prolyl cis-trans isomerase n=1 Tax=Paraglaciecola algarum TaxID=3050085 RepID=A0ABS9DFU7_9ALTE|nr:peptidylprolyl isomerase [Paraglaciecola sp. G1-23]MCF2950486.1 peptidylprolyl isomerase [Paraglaciecola sp. G1-23]